MLARSTLALLLCIALPASAQQPSGQQAPTPPAEPVAPPADAPPTLAPQDDQEISLEDWDRDDWSLVESKLVLLELDGYFRMRGDMFRKLDFDNGSQTEESFSRYVASEDGSANFMSTNLRLRLSPQINVTDTVHLHTTIDVLDNLVLGSTPMFVGRNATPLSVMARGQEPPRRGENALSDSLVVRRAYARVTALNEQLELTFGRMPDNFGLGINANSGDCLDCDFDLSVDRLALAFKTANHLFMPMFDWASNGPVALPFPGGQPIDAVTWDDSEQYSLRVLRVDTPADIMEQVMQGETVVNYGFWASYRRQYRELANSYYLDPALQPGTPVPAGDNNDERRDANIFTGDAYFKLHTGELELGIEGVAVLGSFRDTFVTSDQSAGGLRSTNLYQLGAALELKWRLTGDYQGTLIGLKAGAASGDQLPGYGALDAFSTQRGGASDRAFENFQFSPNYHLDLLMFRRIVGTVTDAWYVSPQVGYTFANDIAGRLWAVYSQALMERSPPNRSELPMGLEFDGELAYGGNHNADESGFKGAIAGGLLFPFGAFRIGDEAGSFAWTIQGRLYITF